MAIVIRGGARRAPRRSPDPTALVVSIGARGGGLREAGARIGVSVRDKVLARRLEAAMTRALRARVSTPPREIAVVRVRSRKALERLRERVVGAVAVVPVSIRNLRYVGEIVETLRTAGAAGVQLAWDGHDPAPELAEPRVFAVLERARATPSRAPVVLAHGEEPVEALRILMDLRS